MEKHCSPTFRYVKYDERAIEQQAAFKARFEELETMCAKTLIPGRATALVATYLEIAYMWVGKSIRDEQFKRDLAYGKETVEQADRDPKADEPKERRHFDANGVEYVRCPVQGTGADNSGMVELDPILESLPPCPEGPDSEPKLIDRVPHKPKESKKPKAGK